MAALTLRWSKLYKSCHFRFCDHECGRQSGDDDANGEHHHFFKRQFSLAASLFNLCYAYINSLFLSILLYTHNYNLKKLLKKRNRHCIFLPLSSNLKIARRQLHVFMQLLLSLKIYKAQQHTFFCFWINLKTIQKKDICPFLSWVVGVVDMVVVMLMVSTISFQP